MLQHGAVAVWQAGITQKPIRVSFLCKASDHLELTLQTTGLPAHRGDTLIIKE